MEHIVTAITLQKIIPYALLYALPIFQVLVWICFHIITYNLERAEQTNLIYSNLEKQRRGLVLHRSPEPFIQAQLPPFESVDETLVLSGQQTQAPQREVEVRTAQGKQRKVKVAI